MNGEYSLVRHTSSTITARPATPATSSSRREPGRQRPPAAAALRPEFYYALFRGGLPASADALFRASAARVQDVWEQAAKQGVIPAALAAEIPDAVQAFQALSATHLADHRSPGRAFHAG